VDDARHHLRRFDRHLPGRKAEHADEEAEQAAGNENRPSGGLV
jgi:hypothetical protein